MMKYVWYSWLVCFITISLQGQFVINSPGDYDLGVNVSGSTGILINANNVTLNLNQQTVSSSANGIEIAAGLTNVIVKNGTIFNSSIGIVINQNCSNIFLDDLLIQNCTAKAIQIVGSSGNLIQRCILKNIRINSCFTSGSVTGIDINFANNIRLEKVNFTSNGILAVTQLIGVSIQNSMQCVFDTVSFKNNIAGIFIGIGCGNSTDSCIFNSCIALANIGTNSCIGFLISSGANNHFLSKCIVANNQATNTTLYGFQLVNASGLGLFGCQAYSNVISTSNTECYGFYCDQLSQCSIVNCQSFENRATGGTTAVGGGFFIGTTGGGTTGVKNCGFFNNIAFGNTGNNSGNSYGFNATSASGGNVNNTYINNKAIRNGTTSNNQIIDNSGGGSSPGGFPNGSVTTRTLTNLNSSLNTDLTNIRIT